MSKESSQIKSKALGKDEVMLLLDLIEKHKVITSKVTNAANNKMKEEAWKSIAQEFGTMAGETRRPEQLRLKWENLKKAARKRNPVLWQNNLKECCGNSYNPPYGALDRVASILGAKCTDFKVEIDDDEETSYTPEAIVQVEDLQALPKVSETGQTDILVVDGRDGRFCKGVSPKMSFKKRQKLSEELLRAQREKELAMAAYYRAKTTQIYLENIKLKLEIKLLKDAANNDD